MQILFVINTSYRIIDLGNQSLSEIFLPNPTYNTQLLFLQYQIIYTPLVEDKLVAMGGGRLQVKSTK